MRRRLFAAMFAVGVMLTSTVSEAAAHTITNQQLYGVHCTTYWSIKETYKGSTVRATMTYSWNGDPDANCYAIEVGMKYAVSAGQPVYTEYRKVYVNAKSPPSYGWPYVAEINKPGYYCIAVQFYAYVGYGADRSTGWITC